MMNATAGATRSSFWHHVAGELTNLIRQRYGSSPHRVPPVTPYTSRDAWSCQDMDRVLKIGRYNLRAHK